MPPNEFLFLLIKIPGLQNDHKALMSEIEKGLHDVHAAAREAKENSESISRSPRAGKFKEWVVYVYLLCNSPNGVILIHIVS